LCACRHLHAHPLTAIEYPAAGAPSSTEGSIPGGERFNFVVGRGVLWFNLSGEFLKDVTQTHGRPQEKRLSSKKPAPEVRNSIKLGACTMDPNNPIIQLCLEGMRAEGANRYADAHALFLQAWEEATDDFEACIAAHYLARRQDNAQETLYWNLQSLHRAEAVHDERVRSFYPSLFLNLGHSYEVLGEIDEARHYYEHAAESLKHASAGAYGDDVRTSVANGLARLTS
jgi:tetratricopeptide (TPR) repeat protein